MANKKVGCHISGASLNHAVYANDMVVPASSAKTLQELLDTYHEFAHGHDITFNATKTVFKTLTGKQNLAFRSVQRGTILLSCTKEVKYLGHLIRSSFKDDNDVLRQMNKLNILGMFS